ncbi:shikimate dehydrogenase [Methanomicrobium sp. W14]|uniref:shikimate dehydrogenase n=1 Tax=Methanomicrobium sp. W14 TaxID=2817839 RepID=UPI001AEAF514|nr:shikimate dehydrogenase [Methanomicrobium sp. W14]MBP2134110.1 shikimate dehydrogenase [Methanomicrobium sp. W14]
MRLKVISGFLGRIKEGRTIRRIVITGFRGAGKSTIGKILSKKLGVEFIDTDTEIEKASGIDIPQIFSEYGEEHFRKLEKDIIGKLPEKDCVISTGGGAVLDNENVKNLRRHSYVVFLDVDPKTSYMRISGSDRPALTDNEPDDEVKYLIRKRYAHYARTSDTCIDASGDPDEICDDITCRAFLSEKKAKTRVRTITGVFSGLKMPDGAMEKLTGFLEEHPGGHICAIAGNPCGHSKSPLIYNTLFERYGICGHYTYLETESAEKAAGAFRKAGLRGISVTIPFKEDMLKFVDRRGRHAKALGAANTVVDCCDNLLGCNTDWVGILRPLENSWIKPKLAVILGAGGAARGAVYALKHTDIDVYILNRTGERAKKLALENGYKWGTPDMLKSLNPDLIINTTPVGMKGNDTLVDKSVFKPEMMVFDAVYTPPETRLLREAKEVGCTCIYGKEMFVYQAEEQFFRMFGIRVLPSEIREILG